MSNTLKWTSAPVSSFPNMNWQPAQDFPPAYLGSQVQPTLALVQNELWCMHIGVDNNQYLWYSDYNADGWRSWESQVSGGQQSPSAPALAEYKDQFWCAYRSTIDNLLATASSEGQPWSDPVNLLVLTSSAPALAAFNARLWCVYSDAVTFVLNYTSSSDGKTWTGGAIPGTSTLDAPALAAFRDRLWCVYREFDGNSRRLMVTTSSNGRTWTTPVPIPGQTSDCEPALVYIPEKNALLCVYGNTIGSALFNYIINTTGDPTMWSSPKTINENPRAPGGTGVGLAEYQGNVFCAYRAL